MALKTRRPTRRTGWPRILISGNDKSGKSWSVAEFSKSERVGRTVVVVLGEDESRWDEYGNIEGSRFELAVWDGTWRSLMETVEAAKEEAARAVAAGEPPFVLAVDTMTAVWESLKDWATERARNSKKNRAILEQDPDAEIDVSSNYWNDARARHRSLMRVLLTFPGIVVLICRGSEVTLFQNGQPVANKTTWSVECEKNLPFDVSAHVQLARDARPKLASASGVHVQIRPGIDPAERLNDDWNLDWLVFDRFRLEAASAAVGGFRVMRSDITPEQIRDEAVDPWTSVARVRELYEAAKNARYAMTMPNENKQEEQLSVMLARIGATRAKARKELGDGDGWLVAAEAMSTPDDAERVRSEIDASFAGVPDSDPKLMGVREAWADRVRQIAAAAEGQVAA